jgi:hypothetical protein
VIDQQWFLHQPFHHHTTIFMFHGIVKFIIQPSDAPSSSISTLSKLPWVPRPSGRPSPLPVPSGLGPLVPRPSGRPPPLLVPSGLRCGLCGFSQLSYFVACDLEVAATPLQLEKHKTQETFNHQGTSIAFVTVSCVLCLLLLQLQHNGQRPQPTSSAGDCSSWCTWCTQFHDLHIQ